MATSITAAQSELISSLSQDEIPIKLRCAICSKLAVNAFRLPCCEQAICETCQSTLPASCPVCEHTPVAAEDCKPHKSLRTTIKVFLRTEEKKRESQRQKEDVKHNTPDTPADTGPTEEATPPSHQETEATDRMLSIPEAKTEQSLGDEHLPSTAEPVTDDAAHNEQSTEEMQESISEQGITTKDSNDEGENKTGDDTPADDARAEADDSNKDGNDEAVATQGSAQSSGFSGGYGFDPAAASGFSGMGFNGDFNQMQMMMAMQNGMGPTPFGNFPMMGMPGMGMDPMAMQNMFMNGGFGTAGMGVNGMNMGMGMAGFDGGVGTGFNNGWNALQSWNIGPDNFNPNAAGMDQNEFGANNPGFTQNATGYAQGNHGRPNQYNDYQNGNYGYQSRGRGRGRGGYMQGRGGYAYASHEFYPQQAPKNFQSSGVAQPSGYLDEQGSIPTGPKADVDTASTDVDEFGRQLRRPISQGKDHEDAETEEVSKDDSNTKSNEAEVSQQGTSRDESQDDVSTERHGQADDDGTPKPIQTLESSHPIAFAPTGPNGFGNYNLHRGGFMQPGFRGGRGGGFGAMHSHVHKVPDVPINAPTGPKAMREGLPNTSLVNLRGRGFSIAGRPNQVPHSLVNASSKPVNEDKDRSRSPEREAVKERDKSRSRSHSREQRRDDSRSERHSRKHRHRSTSISEDEKESERRRERRREHRRRHENSDDDRRESRDEDARGDDERDAGRRRDDDDERSRSRSRSPAHRSSRRSHRDTDKYRERERDSDREKEHRSTSHKHRSSHRSRYDDRSRSRDRDRERRRHHSRRGSEEPDHGGDDVTAADKPVEPSDESRRHSIASNITKGLEIKGASSRSKGSLKDKEQVSGSSRDRERERDGVKERSSRHHRDEMDTRSSRHREADSERSSRDRRDRDKDKDREREKERERDREKEKDRDKVRIPTGPAQDPHTLEREARNRERLLKEAQRIAGLAAGAASRKRSWAEDDARRGNKKGRRSGVLDADEGEEARIARLEAEREGARWA
ncbi:hypothetical protein F5884DRAFT_800247 [Xylogone sp. PMI_703]|nr:hypothetical protein F5884DRAFT_800247 [Xylogone sp. PMI_703]